MRHIGDPKLSGSKITSRGNRGDELHFSSVHFNYDDEGVVLLQKYRVVLSRKYMILNMLNI